MADLVTLFPNDDISADELLEQCKGKFKDVIVIGTLVDEDLLDFDSNIEDAAEIYFKLNQIAHGIMDDN